MKYNWQHPDWPNFTYDDSVNLSILIQYAKEAGRLSGGVNQLKSPLQYEASIDLMVTEAISTSKIEGEHLDREDVRSFIKNFLGLTRPPTRIFDPRAEGVAALMVDLRESFSEPLTKEKLFNWHRMILPKQEGVILNPIKVGQWRTSTKPMQIVSGPIGYEKVHYQAPPAKQVNAEMKRFVRWFNDSNPLNTKCKYPTPGLVRAAIAHLWFESIHPFDDGNGRIGRAISEQALAQDLNHPPLLSLSSALEQDRKSYYKNLHEASNPSMNITPWVLWFCGAALKAQQEAAQNIEFILEKSRFWDSHQKSGLNERQIKVINKMFAAGRKGFEFGVNAKKYISMTGCSKATATRDLAALTEKNCLYRMEGGGRNARYAIQPLQTHQKA